MKHQTLFKLMIVVAVCAWGSRVFKVIWDGPKIPERKTVSLFADLDSRTPSHRVVTGPDGKLWWEPVRYEMVDGELMAFPVTGPGAERIPFDTQTRVPAPRDADATTSASR